MSQLKTIVLQSLKQGFTYRTFKIAIVLNKHKQ